ncbi:MAG: AAA family ATPase [Desulfobacterales bacterium]
MGDFYLPAIRIRGYRPFRDVLFRFNPLEVIIGSNGAGKSSLFEFLKFLRDSCYGEIPPEIISGSISQNIYQKPGPARLFWNAQIDYQNRIPIFYQGELEGGSEFPKVLFERILTKKTIDSKTPGGFTFLDFREGRGLVRDPEDGDFLRREWVLGKKNQLGLGAITDAGLSSLWQLREYIRGWRFYNVSHIDTRKMRRPAPRTHEPVLTEDGGNLSAVICSLKTGHPEAFADLKSLTQFAIPGFRNIDARILSGTGEVHAFWEEEGVEGELNFSDVSDGILRFVALATLCVTPTPPPLICFDDPGQGLHPRTLPVLAGLFEKASERTQVLIATHNSYFMTQFDLENIAIIKKTAGGSVYVNVRNSQTLLNKLHQIDAGELEQMYRADELEALF